MSAIDTELLGKAIIAMRGGRRQLGDDLDHSTGIEMLVRLGDSIRAGQPLVRVFAKAEVVAAAQPLLLEAMTISDAWSAAGPLILDRVV